MTRTVKIILCALAVLIAAGVTLYPLLSNQYAEKTKSLIETQYTEAIQQLDESELIAAREAAHEYNTTLVNVTDKAFSKEALIRASESYDKLLNIRILYRYRVVRQTFLCFSHSQNQHGNQQHQQQDCKHDQPFLIRINTLFRCWSCIIKL